jgi:hypothetical protein
MTGLDGLYMEILYFSLHCETPALKPSGQAVKESLAAEYSTRHPRCSSRVQSHLKLSCRHFIYKELLFSVIFCPPSLIFLPAGQETSYGLRKERYFVAFIESYPVTLNKTGLDGVKKS